MLIEELKKTGKECLDCGACEAVCTSNALQIKWQADGKTDILVEEKRCRDCFMCEMVCPQLYPREDNLQEPEDKALSNISIEYTGSDLLRSIAKDILSQDGYVCGPAWSEGFREIAYTIASNEEEMRSILWQVPIRVQTGNAFRKIAKLLDKGKSVLFFGPPCQVAALRNVLDMDSKYLLTVSYPCQGIIAPGVFQKYMEEISEGRKVADVSFGLFEESVKGLEAVHSNSMIYWKKWPEIIHVDFEDGTAYTGTRSQDALLIGWHANLNFFKGCADCKFDRLPQQSDITMCDVSGIIANGKRENAYVQLSLNNEQGVGYFKKIVKKIKESGAKSWEIPKNRAELFLCHNLAPHPAQKRFLEMNKYHPLVKSTIYALHGFFDVALVGPLHWPDYGLQLSYYVLYKVLKKLGFATLLVADKREWYQQTNLLGSGVIPWYDLAFLEEVGKHINVSSGCFMVGPGSVWDEKIMKACASGSYVLDFAEPCRSRIAYGSTLGRFIQNSSPAKKKWLKNMKAFDYIFVATEKDLEVFAREKISVVKALSPLLLCSQQILRELTDKSSVMAGGEYLFSYLVRPEENGCELEDVAARFGLPLVSTAAADIDASKWLGSYEKNIKLENWLKYLQEATFIITDSPHAVYLALVYEKNFIFVRGMNRRSAENNEVVRILEEVGFGQCLVNRMSDVIEEKDGNKAVDYEPTKKAIEDMRKAALSEIQACLQKGLSLFEQA